MKQLSKSPIINNTLEAHISCKDHSVSNETFSILKDDSSDLLVTSPRPSDADLAKYYDSSAYISHTDAKKSVFDRMYQFVRNYTISKKIKLINSFSVSQKKVLDIGSGTGDFLEACKINNWSVEGVEPNQKARKIAEKKLNKNLFSDLSELDNQKYAVITMWHVLEHVPNLEEYIIALKNRLTKDGYLIVAVPNHKSFDAKHYGNFWAAYDVPRHLWHFSQKSMAAIFESQNMIICKTIPMKFDAFYVSLLSEKYKNGKMNFLRGFYNGLRSNLNAKRTGEYSSLIYVIKREN